MPHPSSPAHSNIGTRQQISTRIGFFIAGFGTAAWAPLVPYAKDRISIDEGMLGLLLLCLGTGSILAMPFAGSIVSRIGCRKVILLATFLFCIALPLLAIAPTPLALAGALFLFGAGIGTVDVTINIQSIIVERASGRAMMSGFHGLYSVGGFAGAGGVSGLLLLGVSPLMAMFATVGIIFVLLAFFGKDLLPVMEEQSQTPFFVWPHGRVMFIGVLCFIVFLTEGSMLDWSALFLTSLRDVGPAHAGLGYAAFAIAMTAGRLTGDKIVHAFGGKNVMIFGGICTASGLALAILVPLAWAGFTGFALVGLGCSNIVPVLYSAIGRQKEMPEHLAVAAVSTIGYSGILTGPAMIGFAAHATSLSFAFAVVAAAMIFVVASARVASK